MFAGQSWEKWSVYLKETYSEKASLDLFNEVSLHTTCNRTLVPTILGPEGMRDIG